MDIGGVGGRGLRQGKAHVFSNDLIRKGQMSLNEQKAWLTRSSEWPTIKANNYVGKRILGAGANGIVGAWELKGRSAFLPKIIVVKQSTGVDIRESLRVESKLLRDILGSGTNHVVKLYKSCHSDGGTGSGLSKDPLPFSASVWDPTLLVSRLYMEYCPNGSLESNMEKIPNDEDIPEEYIWRVLHCLATALVVLRHGNEEAGHNRPTWGNPIVHFDLKPANVLIGQQDKTTHLRLPVFKLADFGLALPLPPEVVNKRLWKAWAPEMQDAWTEDTIWRVTPTHSPPEQLQPNISKGRIGYRSDIWCVGAILYELMTGTIFRVYHDVSIMGHERRRFQDNTFIRTDPFGVQYTTYGRDIIDCPYSKRLINLTHKCLARDPVNRPKPRQLLRAVNDVMTTVYTRVRGRGPKIQLHENLSSAPQYNHTHIRHFTDAEIARINPLDINVVFQQAQSVIPLWTVPNENQASTLPPFIPGQPLNQNAWPWDTTVQPSKAPAPSTIRTRRQQDLQAKRRDQHFGN